jgi:hypothetical protein
MIMFLIEIKVCLMEMIDFFNKLLFSKEMIVFVNKYKLLELNFKFSYKHDCFPYWNERFLKEMLVFYIHYVHEVLYFKEVDLSYKDCLLKQ